MKTPKLALFTLLSIVVSPLFADTVAETVQGPAPTPPMVVQQTVVPNADCLITTNVEANINADALLTGESIRISTNHGVVSLDGTVSNAQKVTEAVSQAKAVTGVTNVKSYLNVQGSATNPNGE